MFEGDEACVEGDGAVVVAARGTVLEVALDRAADVGELAANLVMTAGVEVDVEEVIATLGNSDFAVLKARQLGIRACHGEDITFVAFLVLDEPVFEGTCRLGRSVLDHSPVVLFELAGTHLLHHAAEGFGGLSQQDNTRDGTIKAVDNTTIDLSRLMVAFFNKSLHKVGKTRVAGLVALGNLPGEFVDGQQVVVLV